MSGRNGVKNRVFGPVSRVRAGLSNGVVLLEKER